MKNQYCLDVLTVDELLEKLEPGKFINQEFFVINESGLLVGIFHSFKDYQEYLEVLKNIGITVFLKVSESKNKFRFMNSPGFYLKCDLNNDHIFGYFVTVKHFLDSALPVWGNLDSENKAVLYNIYTALQVYGSNDGDETKMKQYWQEIKANEEDSFKSPQLFHEGLGKEFFDLKKKFFSSVRNLKECFQQKKINDEKEESLVKLDFDPSVVLGGLTVKEIVKEILDLFQSIPEEKIDLTVKSPEVVEKERTLADKRVDVCLYILHQLEIKLGRKLTDQENSEAHNFLMNVYELKFSVDSTKTQKPVFSFTEYGNRYRNLLLRSYYGGKERFQDSGKEDDFDGAAFQAELLQAEEFFEAGLDFYVEKILDIFFKTILADYTGFSFSKDVMYEFEKKWLNSSGDLRQGYFIDLTEKLKTLKNGPLTKTEFLNVVLVYCSSLRSYIIENQELPESWLEFILESVGLEALLDEEVLSEEEEQMMYFVPSFHKAVFKIFKVLEKIKGRGLTITEELQVIIKLVTCLQPVNLDDIIFFTSDCSLEKLDSSIVEINKEGYRAYAQLEKSLKRSKEVLKKMDQDKEEGRDIVTHLAAGRLINFFINTLLADQVESYFIDKDLSEKVYLDYFNSQVLPDFRKLADLAKKEKGAVLLRIDFMNLFDIYFSWIRDFQWTKSLEEFPVDWAEEFLKEHEFSQIIVDEKPSKKEEKVMVEFVKIVLRSLEILFNPLEYSEGSRKIGLRQRANFILDFSEFIKSLEYKEIIFHLDNL